jgi:hypothetical protein
MRTAADLRKFVREAARNTGRANATSPLTRFIARPASIAWRGSILRPTFPRAGVEEFKSLNADGFALRLVMRAIRMKPAHRHRSRRSQPGAVRAALKRARTADRDRSALSRTARRAAQTMRRRRIRPAGDLMRAKDAAIAFRRPGNCRRRDFRASNPACSPKTAASGIGRRRRPLVIRDRIAVAVPPSPIFAATRAPTSFVGDRPGRVARRQGHGDCDWARRSTRCAARVRSSGATRWHARSSLRHGERPPRRQLSSGPSDRSRSPKLSTTWCSDRSPPAPFMRRLQPISDASATRVMDARLSLIDDPLANVRFACAGVSPARVCRARAPI